MTLKIAVQNATKDWRTLIPSVRALTGQAARAAFVAGGGQGFAGDAQATVQLATDAEIQALNANFRSKDKPTNVLSFPSGEWPPAKGIPELYLGDIIIARETVEREALEQGKSFQAHFTHLIIHGVLHLLGHDHMEKDEEKAMEAIEISILSSLGIANPYLLP